MQPSTPETVKKFFSRYNLRHYKKGQILLLDGEGPERIFYLTAGRVKVYDISYRGDEIILNVVGAGTFFPVALLLNEQPNRYIYEAETDIEVHQASPKDVITFLNKHPDVVYFLLGQVYSRVDDVLGRMGHLMASSAKRRLIYELLLECRRFGAKQTNGSYLLEVSEKEIGARAGLSRETVSRQISKLKQEKLVNIQHGCIVICDKAELEWRLAHSA